MDDDDDWKISVEDLTIGREIGHEPFGKVNQALLHGTPVVVKTIRYGASGVTKEIVLKEVNCLRYTFTTLDVFWFVFSCSMQLLQEIEAREHHFVYGVCHEQ